MALRFERANVGNPAVVVAPWRNWAYLGVAMYDATVAAWNAKYRYNRRRPSEVDPTLVTVIANPATPSYPSEHAAVAGAASAILAYFYPNEADAFTVLAEEAARSRLLAGVDYPSDYFAGLELGRAVAARVLERAKADGSAAPWTGSIPQGPGYWNGINPITPTAGTWRAWVLSSSSEFRPDPPPAYNSPQLQAELAEVKNFPRAFETNWRAMFYQSNEGVYTFWYRWATQKMFEYRMADNQPRAARAYALIGIALYDSLVASYEGKYTYWAIRPFQLDPQITALFPPPNHPSYPGNHAALSGAISEVLAYLFPDDAEEFRARAEENAESRIWAGIHYRSDNVAGLQLGRSVGAKIVGRARQDGSL
jgi:membrane-associated phospholipid phosphatase